MVSLKGALTYSRAVDGSPYSVINQASGTHTELPVPGQVISQGQVLYRVNNSPVVFLYGSTPAYRTLSAGATGADVAELNTIWSRSVMPPRLNLPNVRLLRFGHSHSHGEAPSRLGNDPERHPDPWRGGVRAHRRAGDDPVSPARGNAQAAARP